MTRVSEIIDSLHSKTEDERMKWSRKNRLLLSAEVGGGHICFLSYTKEKKRFDGFVLGPDVGLMGQDDKYSIELTIHELSESGDVEPPKITADSSKQFVLEKRLKDLWNLASERIDASVEDMEDFIDVLNRI